MPISPRAKKLKKENKFGDVNEESVSVPVGRAMD
jgi:hypothetical protein